MNCKDGGLCCEREQQKNKGRVALTFVFLLGRLGVVQNRSAEILEVTVGVLGGKFSEGKRGKVGEDRGPVVADVKERIGSKSEVILVGKDGGFDEVDFDVLVKQDDGNIAIYKDTWDSEVTTVFLIRPADDDIVRHE